MNKPIKVAIVGYGMSAKVFHAPLLNCLSEFDIATIYERSKSDSKHDLPEAKIVRTYDEVLIDDLIELIVITTPNHLHFSQVKAALLAGKHVVVEKPFTVSIVEAEELITLAKQVNKVLSIFHNRRWDSDFLWLKDLIKSGVKVYEIDSRFDRFRDYLKGWKEQGGEGTGILYDLGSHLIDQAITLFGDDLELNYVDLKQQRDVAETTDYFEIHFQANATKIILKAGMLCSHSHRLKVDTSIGTFIKEKPDVQEGILKHRGTSFSSSDIYAEEIIHYTPGGNKEVLTLPKGVYLNFYTQLAQSIREGKPNPVTPESALKVMQWIDVIDKR